MSKVDLAKIKSLTFYKDAYTTARRTSALPQLVCVGKPCKLFQPEVVRCESLGGSGTDIDWKCEADLPDSLRFGKVEVSCEGWSKPGDPYVLKGSCSLEYRLVQVPDALRNGKTDSPLFNPTSYDWSSIIFSILWFAFLAVILYSFFMSCFRNNNNTTPRAPRPSGYNSRPSGGGSSDGWFPGDHHDDSSNPPPPPYSKTPPSQSPGQSSWQNWRPGFWTGAALGGLANQMWNSRRRDEPPRRTSYDWERFRPRPAPPPQPQTRSWSSFMGGGSSTGYRRTSSSHSDDRGEGSSNLGSMRRSTGLGGTNVR